jgi:hypothetical protein
VTFFGAERVKTLPNYEFDIKGGVTVTISTNPATATHDDREHFAAMLGRNSFVDIDEGAPKPLGRFALTLEELRKHGAGANGVG